MDVSSSRFAARWKVKAPCWNEAMDTQQIIATESKYTSGVYSKRPIAIVRGVGARLWDSDGKEYIDCVGGQGSANIGHANPAVVRAIAEQASRLTVATEVFYN